MKPSRKKRDDSKSSLYTADDYRDDSIRDGYRDGYRDDLKSSPFFRDGFNVWNVEVPAGLFTVFQYK